MSISSALSTSISGLSAASKAAQTVSNNVANSLTESYGRQEIDLQSRAGTGVGGVSIIGVNRQVNNALLSNLRTSNATYTNAQTQLDLATSATTSIIRPDGTSDLLGAYGEFISALTLATSRPEDSGRLLNVLKSAENLANTINTTSDNIQSQRIDADARLSASIKDLNTGLERVNKLNTEIIKATAIGADVNGLKDIRQAEIDSLSTLVSLKVLQRDNGTVALYSTSGLALLDGSPARFEFSQTPLITPEMTVDSGALSLVYTSDSLPIASSGPRLNGGAIEGLFSFRDNLSVQIQRDIDALANELIARTSQQSVDPTLQPGEAGIFTDAGRLPGPDDQVGLAGRISLNSVVASMDQASTQYLKAGMAAASFVPAGSKGILQNILDSLKASPISSGENSAISSVSFDTSIIDTLTRTESATTNLERNVAYEAAQSELVKGAFLATGVDTDQEMQNLLKIESAYSANAKVIATAEDMMNTLMEIF